MAKRQYPQFIIDRSCYESFPFPFVCSTHKECGFVAKVIHYKDVETFAAFKASRAQDVHADVNNVFREFPNNGGVVLEVVHSAETFDSSNGKHANKRKSLLKNALKNFLFGEAERTPHGDLGIDNQIILLEETILRAKANYSQLNSPADKDQMLYNIKLCEATINTLKAHKALFGGNEKMN